MTTEVLPLKLAVTGEYVSPNAPSPIVAREVQPLKSAFTRREYIWIVKCIVSDCGEGSAFCTFNTSHLRQAYNLVVDDRYGFVHAVLVIP